MARLFVLSQKKIKEQFPFRRNSNDDDDDDWREKKCFFQQLLANLDPAEHYFQCDIDQEIFS